MELYSSPDLNPGEFKVAMNPGTFAGVEPFGVIELGPGTSLHIDSDEDADRLIRAAVRTKEYRARIGVPHEWKSRNGLCEFCGSSKGAHRAPEPVLEPDPAAVLAEAIKNGTPVIVTDDEAEPESDHPYGNAIRAARAWAGHVMPEEPESVLEGTVTAPSQDAPYAPVPRLRRIDEAPEASRM